MTKRPAFVLTKKDLFILELAHQFGFITHNAIALLSGCANEKSRYISTHNTLKRLVKADLLRKERRLLDHGSAPLTLTPAGAKLLPDATPTPAPAISNFYHNEQTLLLAMRLLREDPTATLVGWRQLMASDAYTKALRLRHQASMPRPHCPDFVLDGMAFELELNIKTVDRYREIFDAGKENPDFESVVYVCATQKILDRVSDKGLNYRLAKPIVCYFVDMVPTLDQIKTDLTRPK